MFLQAYIDIFFYSILSMLLLITGFSWQHCITVYNTNRDRRQARGATGDLLYQIVKPKYKAGSSSVKVRKEWCRYFMQYWKKMNSRYKTNYNEEKNIRMAQFVNYTFYYLFVFVETWLS